MPMGMKYSIRGSRRANAAMKRFWENVQELPGASAAIFQHLSDQVEVTFFNEGRGAWQWPDYWQQEPQYGAYKLRTLRDQMAGPLFPNLLRWMPGAERLFPSLTDQHHPDAIRRVGEQRFEFGTAVEYAHRHQDGTGTNFFDEPVAQRKFLIVTADDVAEIRRIMAEAVGI